MSTISVLVEGRVATTEFLTNDDLNANSQLLHTGYDDSVTLTPSTSPDVTKVAYLTVLMSGGTGSIDLTALTLNGVAVTLSGLQPRTIKIKALATNAGDVTVTKGASNGYTGLGASFSTVLKPGEWVQFGWTLDNAGAVGGGSKVLDLAGTLTDGVQVSVGAGT